MNTLYLLLGSNMGDSKKRLSDAKKMIEKNIGKIVTASSIYRTAAWGKEDQPDFLNQIVVATSKLSANDVLNTIFSIEKEMGRIRTFKNAARAIDIDILYFNDDIINTESLTVPHSQMQNRKFVLTPLVEIAPDLVHPLLRKSTVELMNSCTDKLNVQKI